VDLQAVADKIEIQELLYRYARSVDTKDWPLLTSVFTEDAHLDYSSVGGPSAGREEVVGWLAQSLTQLPLAQHFISNIEIDLDGDRAKVRAMFHNPMQLPGVEGMSACGGLYHHEVVRTSEGWKSERLVEENQWFTNPPAGRG
jgi:3-phenylpropionate/cinnamic acid dioxygenase small subunit